MFMILSAILAAAGVIIAVERSVFLYLKRTNNQRTLSESILNKLSQNDTAGALAVCQSLKGNPIAEISALAIAEFNKSQDASKIMNQMNEVQIKELKLTEKRVGLLSTIGNLLTLVGLTGTLHQIITTFGAATRAAGDAKALILKEGLSMAMTHAGLSVGFALGLFLAYSVLKNRENVLSSDLNGGALGVFVKLTEIKH